MRKMNLAAAEVIARAEQRGYTLAEIQPCVLERLPGNRWLVDVDSHYYPHPKDKRPPLFSTPPPPPPPAGPGTEAKRILSRFGIHTTTACSCNKRARQMDDWGIAGCLARRREIVQWFGEEAQKRRLRYCVAAGYAVLFLALVLAACRPVFLGTKK